MRRQLNSDNRNPALQRGFRRFVVVGDSCAEGLDDRYPDSEHYRGWADLVAAELNRLHPGLRYANLAVRGKRLDQISTEQIPAALRLRPDLVALFGGVNDLLARGCSAAVLRRRMDRAVGALTERCDTVVVFTVSDISRQSPVLRGLRGRIEVLNAAVREAAAGHGALLVDLAGHESVDDLRFFGPDRLHLAAPGHRRVAAHVLTGLGAAADPAWLAPLPGPPVRAGMASHLQWAWQQAMPVLLSRTRNLMVRRQPGDGFVAKRPELTPVG